MARTPYRPGGPSRPGRATILLAADWQRSADAAPLRRRCASHGASAVQPGMTTPAAPKDRRRRWCGAGCRSAPRLLDLSAPCAGLAAARLDERLEPLEIALDLALDEP